MRLLKRCSCGPTQNAYESLYNVIWSKCPKNKFCSMRKLQFAAVVGIGKFNFGSSSTLSLCECLGLKPGHHGLRLAATRQKLRISNSQQAHKAKETSRRQKRKAARLQREQELQDLEGGSSYAAELF
ncbi:hypothetical protein PoB_004130100 [Plakobranchus ocellatus]|uniref:Uncharacterized protein n=1 Tax=Plakobranchus ocellatus TaxID=259542 RepID=A0AAV4B2P4_9GAST|nr:hypothetical protein PoB_004130100 [Plakobranchus ocellatus]